jgi:hypothetical protein
MAKAIKPEFIDGISTKGVQIYQLKNGLYRYRVCRRTRLDTDIAIYGSLKEAADSILHYIEHGVLLTPTIKTLITEPRRRKIKSVYDDDYDDFF